MGLLLGALTFFGGWYVYYSQLFRRYDSLPSEPLLAGDRLSAAAESEAGSNSGVLNPSLGWKEKFARLLASYSVVLLCLAFSAFVIVHAFETWQSAQIGSTVLRAMLTTSINLMFPVIATRLTFFQRYGLCLSASAPFGDSLMFDDGS